MQRILILGVNGQLGAELYSKLKLGHKVYPFTKSMCDITDEKALTNCLKTIKPTIIINAAAYTDVDAAEKNFEVANIVNNTCLKKLAKLSELIGSVLIHFSTDYVFDTNINTPIDEDAAKKPINKYGETKHLGEEQIINNSSNFYIFRIGWVYGRYGNNFPKKIISLATQNKELRVIDDQIGTPTSTRFISEVIESVINSKDFREQFGIYNLSPDGATTWFHFAEKLIYKIKTRTKKKLKVEKIIPVSSNEFNTVAKRPKYSCLSNVKLKKVFKIKPLNWKQYLNDSLEDLV